MLQYYTITFQCPDNRAFLFVLYAIGQILCHRFMGDDYDYSICEVT